MTGCINEHSNIYREVWRLSTAVHWQDRRVRSVDVGVTAYLNRTAPANPEYPGDGFELDTLETFEPSSLNHLALQQSS